QFATPAGGWAIRMARNLCKTPARRAGGEPQAPPGRKILQPHKTSCPTAQRSAPKPRRTRKMTRAGGRGGGRRPQRGAGPPRPGAGRRAKSAGRSAGRGGSRTINAGPLTLSISLVGPFSASCGGKEVRFKTRKAGAVLAHIALSETRQESRERLVGLLWSQSD